MKQLFDKDATYYVIIILIIFVFGSYKTAPQLNRLLATNSQIQAKNLEVQQYEMVKNATLNKKNKTVHLNIPNKIYKPMYSDLTLENSAIELVDGIVTMLKDSNNNVWQISYEEVVKDDPVFKLKPSDCDFLKINLKLNGTYTSFKNLLDKLYTWEYLTGIQFIKIVPNQSNKRSLEIDLQLILILKK